MMPTRTPRAFRSAHAFDLMTPAGQVYRFPQPTLFQRAAAWLSRYAEPIILSVVVMGLACAAGVLAESLDPVAANHCVDQLSAPDTPV